MNRKVARVEIQPRIHILRAATRPKNTRRAREHRLRFRACAARSWMYLYVGPGPTSTHRPILLLLFHHPVVIPPPPPKEIPNLSQLPQLHQQPRDLPSPILLLPQQRLRLRLRSPRRPGTSTSHAHGASIAHPRQLYYKPSWMLSASPRLQGKALPYPATKSSSPRLLLSSPVFFHS